MRTYCGDTKGSKFIDGTIHFKAYIKTEKHQNTDTSIKAPCLKRNSCMYMYTYV